METPQSLGGVSFTPSVWKDIKDTYVSGQLLTLIFRLWGDNGLGFMW